MAWVRCKYCGSTVDEKAAICTSCGVNRKTGKTIGAHDACKRRSKFKTLLFLMLLATLVYGGIYIFKHYHTEIVHFESKLAAELIGKTNTSNQKNHHS